MGVRDLDLEFTEEKHVVMNTGILYKKQIDILFWKMRISKRNVTHFEGGNYRK